jgi:aminoglycoside phosphotransferase
MSMAAERTRLAWAETYILVPHVLESGADDDEEEWLVTAALPRPVERDLTSRRLTPARG